MSKRTANILDLVSLVGIGLVGGYLRFVVSPELTEAQFVIEHWPWLLCSVVLIGFVQYVKWDLGNRR